MQTRGVGDGSGLDLTEQRFNPTDPKHEHHPVSENGKDEIKQRPGNDDCTALRHRLLVEGTVQLLFGHLSFTLVQHFHVTAKRNGSDGVFSLIAPETP